jgi:chromosomal replication initiation ATPase DnaA
MTRLDKLKALRSELTREINTIERNQGTRLTDHATEHQDLIADVARRHGVTVAEVLSTDRRRILVWARQEAAYLLRGQDLSYPQIGELLHRDHTTVIHAVRSYDARKAG